MSALLMLPFSGMTVYAAEEYTPVYAESVADGIYNIEVTSSSSMFRIIDCELMVSGGKMTAALTLSGQGYEKLYMGTGEDALSAPDTAYIYFSENEEGKYTYTVPVDALNAKLDCAAWSIRKERWYDRIIVFEADSLPDGVVEQKSSPGLTVACIAVIIGTAAAAATIIVRKRRK
ncbi:MAG: hypothetical protein IJ512_03920 [Ruminococcus sp.]|nr:hypothetical protein [Ruminococcus sp.]